MKLVLVLLVVGLGCSKSSGPASGANDGGGGARIVPTTPAAEPAFEEPARPDPNAVPEPPPAKPLAKNMGGGFRSLRWGASRDEVVRALSARGREPSVVDDKPDFGDLELQITDADGGRAFVHFFRGRLWQVNYSPQNAGDRAVADGARQAVLDKYGPPQQELGFNPVVSDPCAWVWNDGETELVMDSCGPLLRRLSTGEFGLNDRLQKEMFTYTSLRIWEERERAAEVLAQQYDQQREAEQRRQQQQAHDEMMKNL